MAKYRDAVRWIADREEAELLDADESYVGTVVLVAALFGKEEGEVAEAVVRRRAIDARRHQRAIEDEEAEEARMMDADPMYDGL